MNGINYFLKQSLAISGVQKRARKSGIEFGLWSGIKQGQLERRNLFYNIWGKFLRERGCFFHTESSTLILTDLIENIETEKLSLLKSYFFKIGDNHHPNGKTPRDLRMSFLFGKKQALRSYHKIKKWDLRILLFLMDRVSLDKQKRC